MALGDLDLWTMNADGSKKKRITMGHGNDGGAAFSRDGRRLVWRANHPGEGPKMRRHLDLLKESLTAPLKMELVVADAGGGNTKQLTNFGCARFRIVPRILARREAAGVCVR